MKEIIDEKNFSKIIGKYKGSKAQVWLFNATHKRLAIRFSWPNKSEKINEALYIIALGCNLINGPFSWRDSDVEIVQSMNFNNELITKIVDMQAGFELICDGGYGLVVGPETDMDTSFENFLG
jgi:hypothetical protein